MPPPRRTSIFVRPQHRQEAACTECADIMRRRLRWRGCDRTSLHSWFMSDSVLALATECTSAIEANARVPGVPSFRRHGAQALAELFHIVSHDQAIDELHILVAQLSRHSYAQRSTVAHGKCRSIHSIGKKGLRV